jgi:hypothetical protein
LVRRAVLVQQSFYSGRIAVALNIYMLINL